jgi:hypothetical protein
VRLIDPLKRVGQIEEPALCCQLEHAKRADQPKPLVARHPHTLAVIQEHKVRPERSRQCQGCSFSLIEVAECIVERTR